MKYILEGTLGALLALAIIALCWLDLFVMTQSGVVIGCIVGFINLSAFGAWFNYSMDNDPVAKEIAEFDEQWNRLKREHSRTTMPKGR